MITFCQIIAVIVIFNVLFNKKWHKIYAERAKKTRQSPLWLMILLVFASIVLGIVLSKPHSSKETKNQTYAHAPP